MLRYAGVYNNNNKFTMPIDGSPYRSALSSDVLKNMPKDPGSALRAVKVNDNLMSDLSFFLDRVEESKGFYLYQGRQYQSPRNIWLFVVSAFFENLCYYQRASKKGKIDIDAMPDSAYSLAATVFQEQATGKATKGKSHYTKLEESVISKLIKIYDSISTCVLQVEKVNNEGRRSVKQVLTHDEFASVVEEINFVKFKISGWLLNWRSMVTFDQKIEKRMDEISRDVPEMVEIMQQTSDASIREELEAYRYNAQCISANEKSSDSGLTDDDRSTGAAGISFEDFQDSTGNERLFAISGGVGSPSYSRSGSLLDGETDREHDSSSNSDSGVSSADFLKDESSSDDGQGSSRGSDDSQDGSRPASPVVDASRTDEERALRYATRQQCLKRSRGEGNDDGMQSYEFMSMPGSLFEKALKEEDVEPVSKRFKMVASSEKRLDQQLTAVMEYQSLRDRYEMMKSSCPSSLLAVTMLYRPDSKKACTLDEVSGWTSSLGRGFYVPESVPQCMRSRFIPGEKRLIAPLGMEEKVGSTCSSSSFSGSSVCPCP